MPTRKQRTEQDKKQRERLGRVIKKNVAEMGLRSFGDAMVRLKAIPDSEWQETVAQDELTVQAKGPGKGWHGPPKGTHGKTLGKIPGHVWERAGQRTGYKAVRSAIKTLRQNPVLPVERSQQWHMPLKVGGQLRGYLVGSDSFAQTVLGARMTPKSGSLEVTA